MLYGLNTTIWPDVENKPEIDTLMDLISKQTEICTKLKF